MVAGTAGCLLATAGYLYPRIRHLEAELPDAIADDIAAGGEGAEPETSKVIP